jgi:hypothetical protein
MVGGASIVFKARPVPVLNNVHDARTTNTACSADLRVSFATPCLTKRPYLATKALFGHKGLVS